jgi:hypothetical protein
MTVVLGLTEFLAGRTNSTLREISVTTILLPFLSLSPDPCPMGVRVVIAELVVLTNAVAGGF